MTDENGTRRTVIGQGVTVTGDITCEGLVEIDGAVEGTVRAAAVTIGRAGTLKGEVRTGTVSIAGTLEGEVDAKDAVLAATAKVAAQLTVHGPLEIEEGARIEGDLRCSGASEAAAPSEQGGAAVPKTES